MYNEGVSEYETKPTGTYHFLVASMEKLQDQYQNVRLETYCTYG